MKKLFIKAKAKVDLKFLLKRKKIREEKIGLITTVQFEDSVKKLKNKQFIYGGSILGCNLQNALKIKRKVDAFLFIGSGDFHPFGLTKLNKPIYVFNPLTKKFSKISEKDQKVKLSRFYAAKKLGIIVSSKPGQNLFDKAIQLQKKLKKSSYLFMCDDVNTIEFENFPDIDLWINTACPRIEHKKIINMNDLSSDSFKK